MDSEPTVPMGTTPEMAILLERAEARLSEFGVPKAHTLELACELVGAGVRYALVRFEEVTRSP